MVRLSHGDSPLSLTVSAVQHPPRILQRGEEEFSIEYIVEDAVLDVKAIFFSLRLCQSPLIRPCGKKSSQGPTPQELHLENHGMHRRQIAGETTGTTHTDLIDWDMVDAVFN